MTKTLCIGIAWPSVWPPDRLAGRINAMHLKDRLGDIQTDRRKSIA